MERELLDVLDWNLSLTEGDIMAHHEHLLSLTPPTSLSLSSLKRPRSPSRKDPFLSLELSPFCIPPPPKNASALANKTRALTTSITLPGFSSFLRNPYRYPPTSSPSSLQSSLPSVLPVTSGGERMHKRLRLATDPFGPRQPLSLTNDVRHPVPLVMEPQQRSTDIPPFQPLTLSLPWPKAFDPFFLPYIPPVSFYES
jgi:hypothetical protein